MGARLSRMSSQNQSCRAPAAQFLNPSHISVADFVSTLLPFPHKPTDVPFFYHSPHHIPHTSPPAPLNRTSHVILSITPTPSFYTALQSPPKSSFSHSVQGRPLGFLHRPWTLDRRAVPRGTTVLASHTGFDEVLTVGWNVELAARLGLDVQQAVCIQGYKGNPERKIGLLAGFMGDIVVQKDVVVRKIVEEIEVNRSVQGSMLGTACKAEVFDYSLEGVTGESEQALVVNDMACVNGEVNIVERTHIVAMAIMNAFGPDEVQRVVNAATTAGLLANGGQILYLTGQRRILGLEAARKASMLVVCIGHNTVEEWGVRFIASCIREQFRGLDVVEIYEEEVKRASSSNVTATSTEAENLAQH